MTSPTFKQRGVAALEFSFISIILIAILLGMLVYWRAFQAQQALTRASGDGARAILGLVDTYNPCTLDPSLAESHRHNIQSGVEQTVLRTLEQSSMPGVVSQLLTIGSLDWSAACVASGSMSIVRFNLSYQLPSLLGTKNSIISEPEWLSEKSVVHFSSLF